MATQNPRVVGYISPDDYDRLREFMQQYDCTESKAIALIIKSYFSGTPVSTPSSRLKAAQSSTPNDTNDTPDTERIEALEERIEALTSTLQQALNRIETLDSTLNNTNLGEWAA